jgi:hypothetical protein
MSFYYGLGSGGTPSPALNQVIAMNTGAARADIKSMLDADNSRLKPQIGVVFGLPDVYQVAYWWDAASSPAKWEFPSRETLSKHAVCQALFLNDLPYVLLHENYIREKGVPSYVHVLYMPGVWRISSTTAANIYAYANAGNYLWGDLRAGDYCLENQAFMSSDWNYLMNSVFGAIYNGLTKDVNEFDDRQIQLTSPTERLPAGTILHGTHAENAFEFKTAVTTVGEFVSAPPLDATWKYMKAQRVASNLSVAQFYRIVGNEEFGQSNDVDTFRTYIVDFVLWAQALRLASPFAGVLLTTTVSGWDDAFVGSTTTPCASFFMRYAADLTITYTVDHLLKNAAYKVSYTKTGGTPTTKTWTTDSDGRLTLSIRASELVQYYVTVTKA